MRLMRLAVVLTASVAALVAGPVAAALASCAPPVTVEEHAKRADAIVYGRITGFEGGGPLGPQGRVATVEVQRVLKGSVAARIGAALGPGAGEQGGPVATSVDYQAQSGTDHTLYLRRTQSGYETDACAGSHPGAPTAQEERVLGSGGPPQPAPAGGAAPSPDAGVVAALVALLALAAAAAAVVYARRTTRPATG